MEHSEQQSSIKSVLWLTVFAITMIAHIVVDIIRNATGFVDSKLIHGFLTMDALVASVALAIFFIHFVTKNPFKSRDDLFRDMLRVCIVNGLAIFPLGSFAGDQPNVFSLIIDNLMVAVRLTSAVYTYSFLYNALIYQRTQNTNKYLKVLAFGAVAATLFSVINSEYGLTSDSPIVLIIILIMAVVMYITAKRRTWVQALQYSEKKKLLWMSLLGTVVSVLAFATSIDDEAFTGYSLSNFLGGLNILASFGFLYVSVYFDRLFWSSLFSLPNSSVVEKRTFEFSSVAYLNRISAESTDPEKLYATLTQLAMQSTRASSAWCMIYDDKKERGYRIASLYNTNEKNVLALDDRQTLFSIAHKLEEPLVIEFLQENPHFGFLSRSVESFAQSLLITPLSDGRAMIGCLCVAHKEPYSFESEDSRALSAFVAAASVALENSRLIEDSLAKERYHKELVVGRQIQRKLLPQSDPEINGYNVAAFSDPALEVGGDYFDYFTLSNGNTCIIIADVSGKGISAAFYMAKLKGVCLALSALSSTANELVCRINSTLYGSMERQMYITLVAVELLEDGKIVVIRAGHTPALLSIGGNVQIIKPSGLGIGLAKDSFFKTCLKEYPITLSEADTLFLFTDGVNEARNPEGEELGMDKLCEFFSKSSIGSTRSKDVLKKLRNSLQQFSLNSHQHDDITMITVKRNSSNRDEISSNEQLQQSTTSEYVHHRI